MARVIDQITLNTYQRQLKPIVDDLISSSINIQINSKADIESAFINYPGVKGLYIWYATCTPRVIVEKWNERLELYERYKTINCNSENPIITSTDKPINFLLPKVNPQWETNPIFSSDNETEIVLYIGKAQGQQETLKSRLLSHYNGSIQTSALKIVGSTTNELRRELPIINKFLQLEQEILNSMNFSQVRCAAIIIDNSQAYRFLTYERILREYFEPLIGEE